MSIEQSPDVFYMDLLVNNISNNYGNGAILAATNQARTIPYLYNPNQYYAAITSFSLVNTSTPVLNFVVVPKQDNVNLGVYALALSYRGYAVQSNVYFSPQNKTAQVPNPPSDYPNGLQNNSTGYYSVYSYGYFITLVNQTLISLYQQLKDVFPDLPNNNQPYFDFDQTDNLFSLYTYTDYYFDTGENPSDLIQVYLNSALLALFYTLPVNKVYVPELNNETWTVAIINNATSTPNVDTGECVTTQEGTSITLWSQVCSIVITSQTLPIFRNQIFETNNYYSGELIISGNNANSESILLEYVEPLGQYNDLVVYTPAGQYHLLELNSTNPLYNFDFKFYNKYINGSMTPIYLSSGAYVKLTIGFFKKSKFNNLRNIN